MAKDKQTEPTPTPDPVPALKREDVIREVLADFIQWRATCRPEQDETIRLAIVRIEKKLPPLAAEPAKG